MEDRKSFAMSVRLKKEIYELLKKDAAKNGLKPATRLTQLVTLALYGIYGDPINNNENNLEDFSMDNVVVEKNINTFNPNTSFDLNNNINNNINNNVKSNTNNNIKGNFNIMHNNNIVENTSNNKNINLEDTNVIHNNKFKKIELFDDFEY